MPQLPDLDEDLLLAAKGMRRRVQMPFILAMSMGWYSLVAVLCAAVLLAMLRGVFQNPSVSVEPLPPDAFTIMGLFLLLVVVEGAIAATITYALWWERPWSRDLVIGWWAVTTLPAVFSIFKSGVGPGPLGSIVLSLLGLGGAWWYLYRKTTVVHYFQVLAARERRGAQGQPSELQGA